MNLDSQLTRNFAASLDEYDEHLSDSDPLSIEDLKHGVELHLKRMTAGFAASLEIKTHHDLMKSSIDAIK